MEDVRITELEAMSVREQFEALVTLLDSIQGRDDLFFPLEEGDDPEGQRFFNMNRAGRGEEESPELSEAEWLADTLFVSDSGGYNYKNLQVIREYGYSIRTLESDSFGPLVSGICKGQGPMLIFG